MAKFTVTTEVSRFFPHNVTKAADIIIGIARRGQSGLIGDRQTKMCSVAVDLSVMSQIFGSDIAVNYDTMISNPAIAGYLEKVRDRLEAAHTHIGFNRKFWVITCWPSTENESIDVDSMYSMPDLMQEHPAGFGISQILNIE